MRVLPQEPFLKTVIDIPSVSLYIKGKTRHKISNQREDLKYRNELYEPGCFHDKGECVCLFVCGIRGGVGGGGGNIWEHRNSKSYIYIYIYHN